MTTEKKSDVTWPTVIGGGALLYGAWCVALWVYGVIVGAVTSVWEFFTTLAMWGAILVLTGFAFTVVYSLSEMLAQWVGTKVEERNAPARAALPTPDDVLGKSLPRTTLARMFTRLVLEDYRQQTGGSLPTHLSEQQCMDYRATALRRQFARGSVRAEYEAEVLSRCYAAAQDEKFELNAWVGRVAAGTLRRRPFWMFFRLLSVVPFVRGMSAGDVFTSVSKEQLLGSSKLFLRYAYAPSFLALPLIERVLGASHDAGETGAVPGVEKAPETPSAAPLPEVALEPLLPEVPFEPADVDTVAADTHEPGEVISEDEAREAVDAVRSALRVDSEGWESPEELLAEARAGVDEVLATHRLRDAERLLAKVDAMGERLVAFAGAFASEAAKPDVDAYAPWFRRAIAEACEGRSLMAPREQIQFLAENRSEAFIRRHAVRAYLHASPDDLVSPSMVGSKLGAQPRKDSEPPASGPRVSSESNDVSGGDAVTKTVPLEDDLESMAAIDTPEPDSDSDAAHAVGFN